MRISASILLIFLLTSSCHVYYHKGFTYRSTGKMTGIGNKIRLSGYYLTKSGHAQFQRWVYCNDTFNSRPHIAKSQKKQPNYKAPFVTYKVLYDACSMLLFYDDGSFASDPFVFENKGKAEKSLIGNDVKSQLDWGRYILDGDTIKTQFFGNGDYGAFIIFQTWYLINNDSTLSLVKSICKSCNGRGMWKNNGIAVIDPPDIYHFVSFSQKPDSSCWMKEKKWYSYE